VRVTRWAATVVALIAIVVVPASPAGAHAILLRTEPSPQTTLSSAPAAVRLDFSEPVEVAFGAVRVFDVDGTAVDGGPVRRAQGNRQVSVALPRLNDGTYTVTWRAVSDDGHPVSGGFQFYVGAPSSISAVPVGQLAKAPTTTTWGFGVLRFTWFLALFALIGTVAVRRWVWTPAVRTGGLSSSAAAQRFRRRFSVVLPVALAVLLIAGLVALVFQAATVSGLSLVSSAKPSVLRELFKTTYGRAWLVQTALSIALILPVAGLARRRGVGGVRPDVWIALGGVLAAGVCVAAAFNGHARTDAWPALAIVSIALHLFALGLWVGGLGALIGVGLPSARRLDAGERVSLLRLAVPRFSRLAIGAVAAVVATGVINSFANLDRVADLWQVAYGRVLGLKIALLLVALALGWRHLRLPRRLDGDTATGGARSFGRTSALEAAVLAGAVGLAAILVVLVPGRSLALAARGPVNQSQRAGTYTVQLLVDPSAPGPNEVHVTFVDPQGLGAAEVVNATAALTGADGVAHPLALRLIAPGHFVSDADLATRGPWSLAVNGSGATSPLSTTFRFRLNAPATAG
jgi:copper transport protein